MCDLYIILHHHEYGTTTGLVESDHEPGEDEVIRALGLDYEPDKGEWIEVSLVDKVEIVTLPPLLR
jgi:hypothetical protein